MSMKCAQASRCQQPCRLRQALQGLRAAQCAFNLAARSRQDCVVDTPPALAWPCVLGQGHHNQLCHLSGNCKSTSVHPGHLLTRLPLPSHPECPCATLELNPSSLLSCFPRLLLLPLQLLDQLACVCVCVCVWGGGLHMSHPNASRSAKARTRSQQGQGEVIEGLRRRSVRVGGCAQQA